MECYVVIDGAVSHVLLKRPAAGDYRAHGIYGGTVEHATPAPADRRRVEAMSRALPFDLAYARFDVLRVDGRLAVPELEAIEPMLYLDLAPGSADRLAQAALAGSMARDRQSCKGFLAKRQLQRFLCSGIFAS